MNGAQERLRQGDLSSLSYILDSVETAGMRAGDLESPISADLTQLLIKVLHDEGASLIPFGKKTPQDPACKVRFTKLPSEEALTAMRILLSVGGLTGTRGAVVRHELEQLSTAQCRQFLLDAYFFLEPGKRYYAVNFANLLCEIRTCELALVLVNETSRQLALDGTVQPLARAPPKDSPSSRPRGTTSSSPSSMPPLRHVSTPAPVFTAFHSVGSLSSIQVSRPAVPAAAASVPTPAGMLVSANRVPSRTSARAGEVGNLDSHTDRAHGPTAQSTSSTQPPPPTRECSPHGSRHIHTPVPVADASDSSSRTARVVPVLSSTYGRLRTTPQVRSTPSPPPALSLTVSTETAQRGNIHRYRGGPTYGSPNRAAAPAPALAINGASADALQQDRAAPPRRYRALPKTASSTPFAKNPLFDPNTPVSDVVLLTAQFPSPVVLFSRLHGLGCMPKLPKARQFQGCQMAAGDAQAAALTASLSAANRLGGGTSARSEPTTPLLALRRPSQTSTPHAGVSPAQETSFVPASSHSADGSATLPRVASTDRRASMHAAADDPNYYIFPSDQSDAARAYHRVCRDHWLLTRYFEEGEMRGWGCMIHGAVGNCPPNDTEADGTPRPFFRDDELKMTTSALYFQFAPVAATGVRKVIQVACGSQTTFVVTASGTLYASGRCDSGQLGIGERGDRYKATGCHAFRAVATKDGERIVRVAAGPIFGAAMTDSNLVYLWGHNSYGQCMKRPCAAPARRPFRFRTGKVKACDIACGLTFGALVFTDGAMGTWGDARLLGRVAPSSTLEPTYTRSNDLCQPRLSQLPLPAGRVAVAVAAGPWHAAAVTNLGQVFTWGSGGSGRLGHNSTADEATARLVEALAPVFVVSVACGAEHTAVLTSAGEVYVFGDNARGQLGMRGRQPRRSPAQLLLPGPALAISCGVHHTCVLLENGDVMACGALRATGCGLGRGAGGSALVRILENHLTLAVSCGAAHTIALTLPRTTALCRVGHSSVEELSRMESVLVRRGVRAVASGRGFLHIVSENGRLLALGRGERGQTGLGDAMKPTTPGEITVVSSFERVTLPGDDTVRLEYVCCGPDYVLAIARAGEVYGWGSNESAQLGMDPQTTRCVYTPIKLGCYTGRVITQLACGGSFVVALTEDCEVLAHGERAYCGLGGATSEDDPLSAPRRRTESASAAATETSSAGPGVSRYLCVPTEINSLRGVTAIAAGIQHAAALTVSGLVYVWGQGPLGTSPGAASVTSYVPTKVLLSGTVRQLACGPRNTLVITDEGELYVWGCNKYRQCGTCSDPKTTSTAGSADDTMTSHSTGVNRAQSSDVVGIPTRVMSGVRDAAFTGRFSVVVLDSGEVRVAGRLRHQGEDLHLLTHSAEPQPKLSVALNSAPSQSSKKSMKLAAANAAMADLAPRSNAPEDDGAHSTVTSPTLATPASSLSPSPLKDDTPLARGRRGRSSRQDRLFQHNDDDFILNESTLEAHGGLAASQTPTAARHDKALKEAAPATKPASAAPLHKPASDSVALPTSSTSPAHALRAFGGWEQVFVVAEVDRPRVKDVQRAHRGLQVYISSAP